MDTRAPWQIEAYEEAIKELNEREISCNSCN